MQGDLDLPRAIAQARGLGLGAVDPHFERIRTAVVDVADEDGEIAERMAHDISPARITVRQLRAARPAQTRKRRLGRAVEADAAVGIGRVEILACREAAA